MNQLPSGYGAPQPPQNNVMASLSMWLGLASFVSCGLTGIPALVLGLKATKEIDAQRGHFNNGGHATAGIVLGILGCILSASLLILMVTGAVVGDAGTSASSPSVTAGAPGASAVAEPPSSSVAQPSATSSAPSETAAAVSELAARLGQKLDAADAAMTKNKWELAAGLLSDARGIAEAASESAKSEEQIVALGKRQEALRMKVTEFDSRLFEALFKRVVVDEVKEPAGLTPTAAADWDRNEDLRRTREVAKKFGVSVDYANRVYQEGPIVERMKKEAEQQQAADEAQRAALAEQCGASVSMDIAVNHYLDDALNDPDSKKDLSCGTPMLTTDHCWVVKCTYRAKNAFGAYMLSGQRFFISHNRVTHAEPL